jgi:hypothetical protein
MLLEHEGISPQVLDPTSGDCGDEDTDDDDDEGAPRTLDDWDNDWEAVFGIGESLRLEAIQRILEVGIV